MEVAIPLSYDMILDSEEGGGEPLQEYRADFNMNEDERSQLFSQSVLKDLIRDSALQKGCSQYQE